ncbi:MAG: hypothetical protein C4520_15200 [Candidatus Abyssobacteria bacterium SURF_5]|uniref:Sulfurtransferase complex subunit TusB n=1 Tax=Abyssobacteria bacterium (strain SURF_5) TaxID=2093360 RepID=A0A3A4NET2_ABYX5|nr:MAG: hypothetical protein C4520_15200 [Candidatus Abyssubacteria bacterium SURF_5]
MKVLHIIRNHDDGLALRLVEAINRLDGVEQALLMIQDGVYADSFGLKTYACSEDVQARGVQTDHELVDYDRIADMIFEYDRVITW